MEERLSLDRLEVSLVDARPCDGTTSPEERQSARVKVIKGQVGNIRQWDGRIMHSNPPLTIRRRVQQSCLNEQMSLISHQPAPLRPIIVFCFTFKFIYQYSVLVDHRTQNQIISLLLDQVVSICADLIEAS